MKNVKINKNDLPSMEKYIQENSDKPIYVVYNEIKSKKFKDRSKEEIIIFTYLNLNKRKYGIK